MKHTRAMAALAPAFLMLCCADNGAEAGGGSGDLPLDADVAELKREVQKAVDRNIAARQELADSNAELDAVEAKIAGGSADALDFLRAYRNPAAANPADPIAPEVAAPAPIEEPPVFTDVSTPELTPDTTSGGGFAPVIDEAFVVPAEVSGETQEAAGDTAEG